MSKKYKKVKLLAKSFVTHDVKRFIIEKPQGFTFKPGQATHLIIDKEGWKDEDRPFTFTSLNKDKVLEFTIKGYFDHDGVTKKLHKLEPGAELLLENAWGSINYKGPGVFLAGGAGITPFIAILRDLKEKDEVAPNRLIFSNKTDKDIILEKELKQIFSENPEDLILTLTKEERDEYYSKRIDKQFLKDNIDDFSQNFYVCGPPVFVEDLTKHLKELGADPSAVVIEN